MKTLCAAFWLCLLVILARPALCEPQYVKWTAALTPASPRAGEHVQIVVTANVQEPWHIYSLTKIPNGPIQTTIQIEPGNALLADAAPVQPTPRVVKDPNFNNAFIESYEQGVAYGLPVVVKADVSGKQTAKVKIHFQVCNQHTCNRPEDWEVPLSFTVENGPARPEYAAALTAIPKQPANYQNYASAPPTSSSADGSHANSDFPLTDSASQKLAEARSHGILNFLLFAFGAGLAALLTPCVFPMIPITVSFFSKSKQESGGKSDVRGAFAYSLGIIGTFTVLGLLMTAVFGPLGIRNLATNPWTNLVLALLFIVLAANLFGAFEIVLPSWLVDKAQGGKSKGGFLGPLAMGFAFTLTSFTCTVAFVGTLLAAAAQGDWFYPTIGMLAFSTAFALPFFLLAMFPQYLARLPRSGSWMVSVKAFMGFLELAAALKFLSNIDLFFQKGVLTRPVFLAIWAGLGIVAGFYLWGWLRLAVDSSKRFGVARKTIGGLSILAGIWCLAAINGAPLGKLAAFLPSDPYPYKNRPVGVSDKWLHDYQSALMRAKVENKPIFINFTGAQCTNCRDMEANVFPRPEVSRELNKFVLVELITDQNDENSKTNAKLQDKLARVSTLPYYVIATPDGSPAKSWPDRTDDIPAYVRFLEEGYLAALPPAK